MWKKGWDVEKIFGPEAAKVVSSKVPTYPLRGTSGGFYFREADGDDERFEVTKVDPKGPSFGILEVAAECFQQVSNV